MSKTSLSKRVKELGAPSVRWVAAKWGVNESTLYRWWLLGGQKAYRVEVIAAGCAVRDKDQGKIEEIMRML